MRNSLRLRLTIIFIGLATVPLLVVSLLLAQRNFSTLSEQAISLQSEIAQRVSNEVSNLIDNRVNELRLLVGTSNIMQLDRSEQVNLISGLLANQEAYEEVTLLNSDGQEIVRIGSLKVFGDEELVDRIAQPEFAEAKVTGQVYYSPIQFNAVTGEPFMVLGIPSYNVRSGELDGVMVANLRFRSIWDLMSSTRLPGAGIVYLVDGQDRVVAHRDPALALQGAQIELPAESGFFPGLESDEAALAIATDTFGAQEFRTVAELESNQALSLATSNFYLTMVALLVALVVAIIVSIVMARRIVRPIANLAATSEAVAAGDLSREVEVKGRDEIGVLAASFNRMTNQLRLLIGGLEQRVAERTRDLALASEVGNAIAQIRNVDELLATATELIRSRFDLYYVQIYLVDRTEEFLVLRSGTGMVGQELLRRRHRLPFKSGSINGSAAVSQQTVVVADTESNFIFQPNPLLPETRSEMAVPLIVGETVLGVLDLQANQATVLSETNKEAFEILAGQLAVAIENVRLIRDADEARVELEARVRTAIRQDWAWYFDGIHRGEFIGYRYEEGRLQPLTEMVSEESQNGQQGLNLPIAIADEVIGTISLGDVDHLTDEEWGIVHSIAEQVSQQISNLRLLEEAEQYRLEAEEASRRLIREGWTKVPEVEEQAGFVYDQTAVKPLVVVENEADMAVPLAVQGAQIGHLELAGIAENKETLNLVTAVATRLSAHLENLRLTRQTEAALSEARQRTAELNILNEMGAAFAAARETNEMLTLIQKYTSRLIRPTENLYIALHDETTDDIAIYLFYKPGEFVYSEKVENIIHRQSGNGVTEYVMHARKPLLVNENMEKAAAELGFEAIGANSKSWLGVPLVVGERTLGVIAMQSFTTSGQYNEYQMELLMSVASGAAIALESIRLLQQIQFRARQEQILREVTERVYTAVDAESILRTAAQEINRRLGLETFVYLEGQIEPDPTPGNGSN